MDLIVKICGLSSETTMDAALEAGADMVGLVFFPRSPRFVTLEKGRLLAQRARGRAEVVALVVDMDDAALAELVETVRPDWVQLHGRETPERAAHVGKHFSVRTIKAIGISGPDDLARAHAYAGTTDRLLLDATPPANADRPGGNGRPFDWHILGNPEPAVSYLLSGGLTPDSVAEAITIAGAAGVDVSSGVETAPGQKDADLIRTFVANARRAASLLADRYEKVAS